MWTSSSLTLLLVLLTVTATSARLEVSDSGVVNFNDRLYKKHVIDDTTTRPFHLLLLFTAQDAKFSCDVCQRTYPEFLTLAQSYATHQPSSALPLYFGVLDYEHNKASFALHDFASAPHVVYISPTQLVQIDAKSRKSPFNDGQIFNLYSNGQTAEDMLLFLSERSGIRYPIQRSMMKTYLTLAVVLLLTLVLAGVVAFHWTYFLHKMRSKALWSLVSFMFYTLSVGGMVFCIIRDPPPFAVDRSGTMSFVHSGGRNQYVVEGLIIGLCNAVAALSVIALTQWAPKVKDPQTRTMAMAMCLLAFFALYRFVVRTYGRKNSWYQSYSWL